MLATKWKVEHTSKDVRPFVAIYSKKITLLHTMQSFRRINDFKRERIKEKNKKRMLTMCQ